MNLGKVGTSPAAFRAFAILLIALATGYFGLKVVHLAPSAGYDFKFLWLAGEIWQSGQNPYGNEFPIIAGEKITEGNTPEKWAYPPMWWGPAVLASLFPIEVGNVLWNIGIVAIIVLICWLLTASFFRTFPSIVARLFKDLDNSTSQLFAFSLCYFFLSVFEATAIHMSSGQTTLVGLLGAALLLNGWLNRRFFVSALGILFLVMKPHIGLCFIVPLLLAGSAGWRILTTAFVLSMLVSLPAFLAEPTTMLDFLRNAASYDDISEANSPGAMTGIRHIIWLLTDYDIGNTLALVVTVLVISGLLVGPLKLNRSASPDVNFWQVMLIVTSVLLALGPLHTYDFVFVIILVFALPVSGRRVVAIAGAGLILMIRNENLAEFTGLHREGVEIFPGSTLMTIGAIILAVAILMAVAPMNTRLDTQAAELA